MDTNDEATKDDSAEACQCQWHRMALAPTITLIGYAPADEVWPRKGFIGKIIDRFRPRYRPTTGYSGYVACDNEGGRFESQDSTTWTVSR